MLCLKRAVGYIEEGLLVTNLSSADMKTNKTALCLQL